MNWYDGITVAVDPDSVLDWEWQFDDWLETGDSISSHTATAETGITVDSSDISGDSVVVWLSTGIVASTPGVTVHIVTAAGREVDRTVYFQVAER